MTSAKRSRAWIKSEWRFLHTCSCNRRSRITEIIQLKQSSEVGKCLSLDLHDQAEKKFLSLL